MLSVVSSEDALHILRCANFIVSTDHPGDRRFAMHRLTQRGHYILNHPRGQQVLRIARKLFTTHPSPKTRRLREALSARYGTPHDTLQALEAELLTAPAKITQLSVAQLLDAARHRPRFPSY